MLARLVARRQQQSAAVRVARRRPFPSSSSSSTTTSGPSVVVAASSPASIAASVECNTAARHLRRTYTAGTSPFRGCAGSVVGTPWWSSGIIGGGRGGAALPRVEEEGRFDGSSTTTMGRMELMRFPHRSFSSSLSMSPPPLPLVLQAQRSFTSVASRSEIFSTGPSFRDERYRRVLYRDNPMFMQTMDNVVRRAMSSSAPQQTSTVADEKPPPGNVKPATATAAVPSPPPPPPPKNHAAEAIVSSLTEPAATAPSTAATAKPSSSPSAGNGVKKQQPSSELTNPPTLLATVTNFAKAVPGKVTDLTAAAIKAVGRALAATPGVLWYYLTHPKEFRQKLVDLKEAAKKEAHHYWMGSKLLAADVRTARSLLNQTLRGSPLTRRERKQLLRTVSDVFRLVPMSVFVLIPFMEFALPFALKIFPNMLPSTFQDSLREEENMKRELRSRIAMAEFFQETLQDLAKDQKNQAIKKKKKAVEVAAGEYDEGRGDNVVVDAPPPPDTSIYEEQRETAASFLDFIEKARKGEMIPPEAIIKFSTYFKDELTLDNMPRMQLVNMSRYMGLPPYGSDNFLRLQLRFKIRSLLEDDQRILWEGIDSLTKMELREACRDRGMRSTGLSKDAYKRALQQWLDLSVNKNVPISLLIMSRTFFLQDEMTSRAGKKEEDESNSLAGLADAISGLDKEVLNEVVLEVASAEEKTSNPDVVKIKLEVLEHQNEKIAEEKKERDEAAAKKKQAEEEKKAEADAEAQAETAKAEAGEVKAIEAKEAERLEAAASEVATGVEATVESAKAAEPAPTAETVPAEEPKKEAAEVEKEDAEEIKEAEEERSLYTEEMEAISEFTSPDPVHKEREELERLKAAMKEQEEEEETEEEVMTAEVTAEQPEDLIDVAAKEEAVAEPVAEAAKEETQTQVIEEPKPYVEPIIITDESDKKAAETIAAMDAAATEEAAAATKVSFEGEAPAEAQEPAAEKISAEEEEEESRDERLDKAVDRLKSRVESMVGKIEVQLSDVEAKIGDRLHLLDKDGDGTISMEEMAEFLKKFLKRELTEEEAMAIAHDMDMYGDGIISMEELVKWIETNKLYKLVEEGRDGEVDRMIEKRAAKVKEMHAAEANAESAEGELSSQDSKTTTASS